MPLATIPVETLSDLLANLDDDDREGDALLSAVRSNLKMMIEMSLEVDRTAQLGRARNERKPGAGYRNGYYERELETGFGLIRELRVPRLRAGRLEQRLFDRYQRRRCEVERMVRAFFFAGASTRAVGEVLEIFLGFAPSATTVSRIVASVDKEVAAFHARPITQSFRYLFLDGLTVTLKEAPSAKKRLLLVAYGITPDGRRTLIDYRVAPSESREEWERFLGRLLERGLTSESLCLITTDGGKGVRAAIASVFPNTPAQLCWAHKLRNVAGYLRRANQAACMRGARRIYLAPTRREALAEWKAWKAAWETAEPAAVRCLATDLEALLTFLGCPEQHRAIVRTTNYIERLIRELRRRTRPMGAFAHKTSCERLFYGVIKRLNKRWAERKPLPGFTQNS